MKMLDWLLHPRKEYIDSLCSTIAKAQQDVAWLQGRVSELQAENGKLLNQLAEKDKQHNDWLIKMVKSPVPQVRQPEPEWMKEVDWERVNG